MIEKVPFYNHRTDPPIPCTKHDMILFLYLLREGLLEKLGFTREAMTDDEFFEDMMDFCYSIDRCFLEKSGTDCFLPKTGEDIVTYCNRTLDDFCAEFIAERAPGSSLKALNRRNGLQITRAIYAG